MSKRPIIFAICMMLSLQARAETRCAELVAAVAENEVAKVDDLGRRLPIEIAPDYEPASSEIETVLETFKTPYIGQGMVLNQPSTRIVELNPEQAKLLLIITKKRGGDLSATRNDFMHAASRLGDAEAATLIVRYSNDSQTAVAENLDLIDFMEQSFRIPARGFGLNRGGVLPSPAFRDSLELIHMMRSLEISKEELQAAADELGGLLELESHAEFMRFYQVRSGLDTSTQTLAAAVADIQQKLVFKNRPFGLASANGTDGAGVRLGVGEALELAPFTVKMGLTANQMAEVLGHLQAIDAYVDVAQLRNTIVAGIEEVNRDLAAARAAAAVGLASTPAPAAPPVPMGTAATTLGP